MLLHLHTVNQHNSQLTLFSMNTNKFLNAVLNWSCDKISLCSTLMKAHQHDTKRTTDSECPAFPSVKFRGTRHTGS